VAGFNQILDRDVTTKIPIRHLRKAICVFDAMVQLQIQGANTKEKIGIL
jgi:hypothetical protein